MQPALSPGLHCADATQMFKAQPVSGIAVLSQPLVLSHGVAALVFLGSQGCAGGYPVHPHICHTHVASENQLQSCSKIPAASFALIAHLKLESQRRQKYFFCIYSEHVVARASSYSFGANKKLLICEQCKMLAVLQSKQTAKTTTPLTTFSSTALAPTSLPHPSITALHLRCLEGQKALVFRKGYS